jgi:PAS domain S-box-containing protein
MMALAGVSERSMDAVTSAPSSLPTDVWRTLADQLPQLAWIADGSGKVLWVNRRWSEFTGLAAHELTERGWRPLLHPDASEQVERGFEVALAGSCQWQDEFPLRGKDGTYRQFLGRAEPVRGTDGEVAYWFGTATDISERFAAEEEARTAAQRLRRAVTIANLFVWETDWVTRKISWGENAAEILGLRPEDLPTGPDDGTFFVADEDAERLRGEFADALSRGDEAVTVEFRGRDGRFWRAECQIDRDADGKVLRVHGATRETTREVAERRRNAYLLQLDDALRMSSEASVAKSVAARLLGEELNASRVLYAEVSSDGRELLIEDEYLAPGVPSIAGVHRAPEAILSRHREGRPIVTADFRKDDHLAAVRDNPAVRDMPLCAILDAPLLRDGKLVGVLAVHDLQPRDWTEAEIDLAVATAERTWESVERSRTEEQLRFSEARFRSTAEALPGMLFLTDAVGNNLYVNPYYRDYAGVSDQDVAGDGWIAVVHPDDLSRVREASAEAIARGTIFGLDYRLRRKDGEWRWHSSRATPLRSNGDVVGWVGISLDVHDRRMAEEQARLAADEIAATYATAPIGLAVFDNDLRYIRVNQRLAEMNGTPMDEHIGKTLQEIVPGISGELGGAIRRALDGEEVWGYEVSGETKSAPGVLRTWRSSTRPPSASAGSRPTGPSSRSTTAFAKSSAAAARRSSAAGGRSSPTPTTSKVTCCWSSARWRVRSTAIAMRSDTSGRPAARSGST